MDTWLIRAIEQEAPTSTSGGSMSQEKVLSDWLDKHKTESNCRIRTCQSKSAVAAAPYW